MPPFSDLSMSERLKIRSLAVEQRRRKVMTRAMSSPLLRWRYAGASADQILIVPQELRPADPSFWFEFQSGNFGLANEIADLRGASPFGIRGLTSAWERELHGFSWLRHFAAAAQEPDDAPNVTVAARDLVVQWIESPASRSAIANEPAVVARRIMSWIAQAHLLLESADAKTYSAILSSIGRQVVALKSTWRNAPDGVPRLVSLIALVISDLAISGHDRQLADAEAALIHELNRQILPDGGHISRNASVLADLVLDLLPLSQCFQARNRHAPDAIGSVVQRALKFLRFMRLGDGMLARFNGVSTGAPATVATVLGYCGSDIDSLIEAPQSGYARIECGDSVVIVDVGSTPPFEVATAAQAGTLAFEMSTKARLIFVNGGYPSDAYSDWSSAARATASHNTVSIAETSSARMVRDTQLEQIVGGIPIRGPELAAYRLLEDHGSLAVAASHDGYARRYGVIHNRRVILSESGDELAGLDTLELTGSRAMLPAALPFAVHFHVHPDCRVRRSANPSQVMIVVDENEIWSFTANIGTVKIEDSLFYVDSAGPRPTVQIVIRGTVRSPVEIRWSLTKVANI